MRIGHGYDVHRLVKGRELILGGVSIPYEKGLLGHSDADVLTHAVMDALLGAAALGDIGKHFPDSDPAYKGADSLKLAQHVSALLTQNGYCIGNIDPTHSAHEAKACIGTWVRRESHQYQSHHRGASWLYRRGAWHGSARSLPDHAYIKSTVLCGIFSNIPCFGIPCRCCCAYLHTIAYDKILHFATERNKKL